MSGYSELIKNFSKTRDYVRDFFIYGFKVRNDFKQKSSRTYDNEKRRVESWLGNHLRYENSERGKRIAISVDSGHVSENPLYQAYYSKSFTDNDIKLHFCLIDILADEKSRSLREITELLDERFGTIFDEQTVRNKLKEYVKEGIFISEKSGKTTCFRISRDTVSSFFEEFKGLDDAVKFFSETQEFGIIGNSILKSQNIKNNIFLMKHNYIVHTLEDEILIDIIEAIEKKSIIRIKIFSSVSKSSNASEQEIVPMQILSSLQTGRRYLAAYVPQYRRFNSYRLDSIKSLKLVGTYENYDDLQSCYQRNIEKCFGVSFGMRRNSEKVDPLKITLTIDEKNEKFVIERLEREKRCGTVKHIGKNLFTLTLDVFDPNEVMQWLKTFIGRIVSAEGGTSAVQELLYSDIRRMYKMYGDDFHGNIQ